jgi:hypothetical protein
VEATPVLGQIDIAKDELNLSEIEPATWEVLKAGNELRNKIAHGAAESVIAAKMTALRKAYLETLPPEQRKGAENLTDVQLVVGAFSDCGSYLFVAAERLREEKKKTEQKG